MAAVGDSRRSPGDAPPQVTRVSPFTIAAYVTLFADAYLVLASLASKMMQNVSASYLLPFHSEENPGETHVIVLVVATWTSVLAVGCLSSRQRDSHDNWLAGVVWIGVVLAIPWLFVLMPMASNIVIWAKQLFLYGP